MGNLGKVFKQKKDVAKLGPGPMNMVSAGLETRGQTWGDQRWLTALSGMA